MKLRMSQTVPSADAHVNDTVQFEVLEDVKVADVIVIPKGGIAWGTVTEAEPKRRMARGGKLEIVMDSVRLTDGEKAALRATKEGKGGGHTGAMTAGIVATGLIFFPAAPFFLFMHGKDITFPKGSEVPTFINGNFELDLSKFQPMKTESASTAAPTTTTEVSITYNPSGADVTVDGSFVGDTPSKIGLPSGDHVIDVSKKGFKPWERKIKTTTGQVDLAADLDPEDKPSAQ